MANTTMPTTPPSRPDCSKAHGSEKVDAPRKHLEMFTTVRTKPTAALSSAGRASRRLLMQQCRPNCRPLRVSDVDHVDLALTRTRGHLMADGRCCRQGRYR
eukprot:6423104-Prymnesium_polylepis.1